MHKLARQVRFSVNPFLPEDSRYSELFSSEPTGEGLSIFFELCVVLTGDVEPATGFVVNVTNIKNNVLEYVAPIFTKHIKENFQQGKHVSFFEITKLLKLSWEQLTNKFGMAKLSELTLAINPFRKITVDYEDCKMIYFTEKFEFAATHKLWNDDFTSVQNLGAFGKCANPSGHGHNYTVEVTLKTLSESNFCMGEFGRTVEDKFIKLVDHKNLNIDVPYFAKINPTMENIAVFAWENLMGKFGKAALHCITVWETDKTYCSYYGK